MKSDNSRHHAYIQFISSMLIIGTIGIFRRYIPLPSSVLACLRGLIGAVSLCVFVKLKGGKIGHETQARQLAGLFLTGAVLGFNWMLLFEAYRYTTVAVATLCYYLQPTIVILVSPVFFHERLTKRKLLCALIALAGMVLVSGVAGDGAAGENLKGILFGLAAAVFYSMVVILNKRITDVDSYEKTIIELFSSAVILIPYILLTETNGETSINSITVLLVLIVGVVHTGIVYALYFGSMEHMEAQAVAVLSYIDPVVAVLVSALFLKEPLGVAELAGACLIIGAAVISERIDR